MKRLMILLLFAANIACSDADIYVTALKAAYKMVANAPIGVLGNRDFEHGFYSTAAKKLRHIGETLHPVPGCSTNKAAYAIWTSKESFFTCMNDDNDRHLARDRTKYQADCNGSTSYETYLKTLRLSDDPRSLYLVGLVDLYYPHHLMPNVLAYASFRKAARCRHGGALFFMGLRECERKQWGAACKYFSRAKNHPLCTELCAYAAHQGVLKKAHNKNITFASHNTAKSVTGNITQPSMKVPPANKKELGERKRWKALSEVLYNSDSLRRKFTKEEIDGQS